MQWPALSAPNPKVFICQTQGIHPDAGPIIESLQPYHEGPDDAYMKNALWQLHTFDIIDKHRPIPFNQVLSDLNITGFTAESDPKLAPSPFGGAELSVKKGSPPTQIRVPPKPTIRFGSNEERLSVTLDDLFAMHRLVTEDILPRFEKFFPENHGSARPEAL